VIAIVQASCQPYQRTFAAKASLTNPTFHAVVRLVSLQGFGIVPFFTPRHIVAAETPYNPIITGRRINAEFGIWSKFASADGIMPASSFLNCKAMM
jgi:hypothetical protein